MGGNGMAVRGTTNGTSVSTTSTGGRLVQQGSDQWYGETNSGYAVSVLDAGREDINLFRYGSRQIYEVTKYDDNNRRVGDIEYISTKKEALSTAKAWLNGHK